MKQNNRMLCALCAISTLVLPFGSFAQALKEKKDLRFYEHHSSDMTDAPLGYDANGKQSGYDFVNNRFFNSFNEATYDAYTQGEEANIDMVEHNGPYGTNGASMYLGFTSGVSTIWGGPIKGNGLTKWMKAPSGFNYATITDMSQIKAAWSQSSATVDVAAVHEGDVYIGRIRGSETYVVIRCHDIHIPAASPSGQRDNIYFGFDYKYNGSATGIAEETSQASIQFYPNPAEKELHVKLNGAAEAKSITLYSVSGAAIAIPCLSANRFDVSHVPAGVYVAAIVTGNGDTLMKRIFKAEAQ